MTGIDRACVVAYLNRVIERYARSELCTAAALGRIAMVLPCQGRDRAIEILATEARFELRDDTIVEVRPQ